MNKAVVVYSPVTGEVLSVYYGTEELIPGVPCMVIEIPENAVLSHIDVYTLTPMFKYFHAPTLESIQQQTLAAQTAAENAGAAAANNSDAIDAILIYMFGGD